jgi:hypothetical protein
LKLPLSKLAGIANKKWGCGTQSPAFPSAPFPRSACN